MPSVKSTDPMKAEFINAVRAAFPEVSKLTNVTVNAKGVYRGIALRYDRRVYDTVGVVRGSKGYTWDVAMLRDDPDAVARRAFEAERERHPVAQKR